MDLHILANKDLEKNRDTLLPYIESFVERSNGRYEVEDVFNNVRGGYWTIWVVHQNLTLEAVLITQIIQYPKAKELQIIMCVGKGYENWYPFIHKLEEGARLTGCNKVTAITRPGWEKIMQGYKKTHVYLERDL